MPRASFSHTVDLSIDAAAIWAALQDAATWSGIGPVDEVWDATHDDAGRLASFSWSAHVGPTKHTGTAKVSVATEPHHMRLQLDSSELSGALIADITEDEPTLAVTLEVASKGAMASMFFPIIAEAIGRGLPAQVEEFAASIGAAGSDKRGPRAV